MKLKTQDVLLIVLLGLIVVIAVTNFGVGCKEGFLSQFGDQIDDPFLVDYANLPTESNPTRMRWNAMKDQVPLSDSTNQYPYTGLSGDIFRPDFDNGYYNMNPPC